MAAIPKEIPELTEALNTRGHRVFFGAYDPAQKPIGLAERFVNRMPAARDALPQGNFRDWPEIEAWATEIASALRQPSAG